MGLTINKPRYLIEYAGAWYVQPSDGMPTHEWTVVDSWIGTVASRHHGEGKEAAKLVAETRCSELNAPIMALDMLCGLALHISEARNEPTEANPGDLVEDLDRILEHFIGQLRGMESEPLDDSRLRYPAPRCV